MDFRTMFDNEHIGAWDLEGRDVNVQIEKVTGGTVIGDGGRKAKKIIMSFSGKEKTMVVNKTNAKTIAAMYGKDVRAWSGKWITLFPSVTQVGSEDRECIRVRPRPPRMERRPAGQERRDAPAAPPADEPREPGSDG